MIDPKTNASLLSVKKTASRELARAEMQKMADFIHHWLYGDDPAPELRVQVVRAVRRVDGPMFDIPSKDSFFH